MYLDSSVVSNTEEICYRSKKNRFPNGGKLIKQLSYFRGMFDLA